MKRAIAVALAAAAATAGCAKKVDRAEHARILAWRQARLAKLTAPDGWLTLVGLYWLEPGDNTFGSDAKCRVVLPAGKAPGVAGTLRLENGRVTVAASPGAPVMSGGGPVTEMPLLSDADANGPTLLTIGSVTFYVIDRDGKLGVRVKDSEAPLRKSFPGLDHYAVDPTFRFEAKFIPYEPPKKLDVPNEIGSVEHDVSPGAFEFQYRGKPYRIDPVFEKGSKDLFIIFGDTTNGDSTYGGGRFVYAPMPKNGTSVLDFNEAYNPPCVFTPYATCPLPPPQNRLPFPVTAGEKRYTGPVAGRPAR